MAERSSLLEPWAEFECPFCNNRFMNANPTTGQVVVCPACRQWWSITSTECDAPVLKTGRAPGGIAHTHRGLSKPYRNLRC